jgi:hypothetical protein
MDFNFYINNDDKQPNENLERVLDELEHHFEDWNNFYNLYTMFAPPPTQNTKQIQGWFSELKTNFLKIIELYNDKVNKFADIVETDEEMPDIVKHMVDSMKNKKGKAKKDDDRDDEMSYMFV